MGGAGNCAYYQVRALTTLRAYNLTDNDEIMMIILLIIEQIY